MSFPENLQIIMLSIAVSIGFCVVACLFAILVNTHLENQRLESMTLWNKDQNGRIIRTSFVPPNRPPRQQQVVIDTSPPEELIREESLPSDHGNYDIIEEIQEIKEVSPISLPKQVRLKNKSYMDEWRPEKQQNLGLDFSRRYQYSPSITIKIEDADSSAASTLITLESDHTDNQSIYSSISSSGESSKSDFNPIEEIEINWVGKPGHEIFLPNSYESCYLFGFNGGRESAIIVTAS